MVPPAIEVLEDAGGQAKEGSDIKWTTLVHNGVLFPPEYQPHGVKLLYDGRPIDLSPAQVQFRIPPLLPCPRLHLLCPSELAVDSASVFFA